MSWPESTDYVEAVQNLGHATSDAQLRTGRVAETPLGLPLVWSGNFADVYEVHTPSS